MSLSRKIIIGLLAGIVIGLFLGEYCAFFSYPGDAFIGLLQMTVLPYIMISIITNLGRMSLDEGRDMISKGLKVLLLLLLFGIAALVLIPLSLPEWTASSFFNPSVVEAEKPLNLLDLYIPSNPFASMANNIVPAIVVFSIFLGIGLAKLNNKEALLTNLDIIGKGLTQINHIIIKFSPYGIFSIAAFNAGTMTGEEIHRLHAYIIIYSVAVLLLGFYWLPLLISSFTGISPKALFNNTKSTLLTIFVTGKIIIVLPQLIDNVTKLMNSKKDDDPDISQRAGIMMPLAYPFPNLGTFVIFVFVPFIAWYLGQTFDFTETIGFLVASFISSFIAPITGIPFLLDIMRLPQEMFHLFVISSVYTDRIRVVLGAIHLLAITIITIRWTLGGLSINWKKLIRGTIIGLVITAALLLGTKFYLTATLGKSDQYESLVCMEFLGEYPGGSEKDVMSLYADSSASYGSNQLSRIKRRGTLRVGYLADRLPFAFRNTDGIPVGFDIEMAHILARELGVKAGFYKVTTKQIIELFAGRKLDIVMCGIPLTTDVTHQYSFSNSYMDVTLAFVVPDHKRSSFNSKAALFANKDLRIGSASPYFTEKLKLYLPDAEIVKLSSPREFYNGEVEDLDALLQAAETGSAWTIIYPSFNVTVPHPDIFKVPCAYPLPKNDETWSLFINTWLELKQKDGTIDILFEHWIEGQGAELKEPRWSIMKDVLHWVDK